VAGAAAPEQQEEAAQLAVHRARPLEHGNHGQQREEQHAEARQQRVLVQWPHQPLHAPSRGLQGAPATACSPAGLCNNN
jgi:hypothetical protein